MFSAKKRPNNLTIDQANPETDINMNKAKLHFPELQRIQVLNIPCFQFLSSKIKCYLV